MTSILYLETDDSFISEIFISFIQISLSDYIHNIIFQNTLINDHIEDLISSNNTNLSNLICARIDEHEFLGKDKPYDKDNTTLDLRNHITNLKHELEMKSQQLTNLQNSNIQVQGFMKKYKNEMGNLDQKKKIGSKSVDDLKEYVLALRKLKAQLKDKQPVGNKTQKPGARKPLIKDNKNKKSPIGKQYLGYFIVDLIENMLKILILYNSIVAILVSKT